MPTPIAPYIDETGIHVPDFAAIQAYFVAGEQSIFGADIYLGDDSQDGQLIGVLSAAFNDVMAGLVATYNQFSPSTAQGAGLSSVVKTNGIARNIPTYSTVDLDIGGQSGTVITDGVVTDTNNVNWALPHTVTIPGGGSITVTATCTSVGAITAQANTVNKIATPTRGWQTANNATIASPGAPVESDPNLRRRQAVSSALPAMTVNGGTIAAVADLVGVTQVQLHENYTDTTDGAGVPPHSIAVLVVGGDADQIASAIALKKTPGTGTFGTTSIDTLDPDGIPITIEFSRPVTVDVTTAITVRALAGYSSDVTTAIEVAVAAYINSLVIGQSLYFTRVYLPAQLNGAAESQTYEVTALTINGGTTDITAAYNEQLESLAVNVTVI